MPMNRRFPAFAASLLLSLCAPLAGAQSGPPAGSQPPPPPGSQPPAGSQPPPGSMPPPQRSLPAMKQHRLDEIAHHMAMLQQEQVCVQNAADHEQLRACKSLPPPRP